MTYEVDDNIIYNFKESSMAENRDFLYSLVKKIKPNLVAELGTYYGCSYFAFAQAIKDLRLKTSLVGVDSWEGDIHTGFYNDMVFETFKSLKSRFFSDNGQYSFIRNRFELAVDSFENSSIDILMIDGTHDYQSAKQDFEMYLPKLKENGIVLFHDVCVEWFTLKAYWNELIDQYPSRTIRNKYGLGMLAPKGDKYLNL